MFLRDHSVDCCDHSAGGIAQAPALPKLQCHCSSASPCVMGRDVILGAAVAMAPGLEPFPRKQHALSVCWVPTMPPGTVLPWHTKGPAARSGGHTQLHSSVSLHGSGMLPEQCPAGLPGSPGAPSRDESSWCQCLGGSPRAGSSAGPFPGRAASLCPCPMHRTPGRALQLPAHGCRATWAQGEGWHGDSCRNEATLAAEQSSITYSQ